MQPPLRIRNFYYYLARKNALTMPVSATEPAKVNGHCRLAHRCGLKLPKRKQKTEERFAQGRFAQGAAGAELRTKPHTP